MSSLNRVPDGPTGSYIVPAGTLPAVSWVTGSRAMPT